MKKNNNKMTVLSKPLNLSFDLSADKTEAFFAAGKKDSLNKAIERSNRHRCKSTA